VGRISGRHVFIRRSCLLFAEATKKLKFYLRGGAKPDRMLAGGITGGYGTVRFLGDV
jgi:hypothetical protein